MTRRDRDKPGGCSDPVAGYALRICLMHKIASSSAGADRCARRSSIYHERRAVGAAEGGPKGTATHEKMPRRAVTWRGDR
jgi:hypothetical protein